MKMVKITNDDGSVSIIDLRLNSDVVKETIQACSAEQKHGLL